MGKKQTCPYCKEKVDLKRMFPSPYPLCEKISRHILIFLPSLQYGGRGGGGEVWGGCDVVNQ